jgi:hypothetical protein
MRITVWRGIQEVVPDHSCLRNGALQGDSGANVMLQSQPINLLSVLRRLARNPSESQREDDDNKRALLGKYSRTLMICINHAYAPQGGKIEDKMDGFLTRLCFAEALKLRHEYAMHPEGWVARRKRSNRFVWHVPSSACTHQKKSRKRAFLGFFSR